MINCTVTKSVDTLIRMSTLNEEYLRNLLSHINDPHAGTDIVSLGWLRGVGLDGARVSIDLRAAYPIDGIRESLVRSIVEALESRNAGALREALDAHGTHLDGWREDVQEPRQPCVRRCTP